MKDPGPGWDVIPGSICPGMATPVCTKHPARAHIPGGMQISSRAREVGFKPNNMVFLVIDLFFLTLYMSNAYL